MVSFVLVAAACGRHGFELLPDELLPDADDGLARVTIEYQGIGVGTVVGPNGFTCNEGSCTLAVPGGTPVTLRGLAATDSWFAGWTNVCGGNFECTFSAAHGMTILAEFTPTPNRVFVTSTSTDGAFGGVAAADAICAARANAVGLNGTFIAYVSDAVTNAASRLVGSRGWVRVDGAPFADAATAFSNSQIVFPPRTNEFGDDVGRVPVYTGTDRGAPLLDRCQEWTSGVGTLDGGMSISEYARDSVGASSRACTTQGRLMCLEIGRDIPVTIHPNTGLVAFATRMEWRPGGGRADADALCASEAASVGLTGTFLAALATTTESIANRFPAGQHYRRVDGVRLVRSNDLFDVDWLDVPPELDQTGQQVSNDFWTGATRFNEVPMADENCNDWMDGTTALRGHMHLTNKTDVRTPAKTDPCNASIPLLCLERGT